MPQPAFDLECQRDAFQVIAQLALHDLGFLRMDQRQPVIHGAEAVFRVIAQQFAPARREIDGIVGQPPVPDAVTRPAHHQVEALALVDALGHVPQAGQQRPHASQGERRIARRLEAIVHADLERLDHQFLAALGYQHDDRQGGGAEALAQARHHAQRLVRRRSRREDQQSAAALFDLPFGLDEVRDALGRKPPLAQDREQVIQRRALARDDDGVGQVAVHSGIHDRQPSMLAVGARPALTVPILALATPSIEGPG